METMKYFFLFVGCFLWGTMPFTPCFLDDSGFMTVVLLPTLAVILGGLSLHYGATLLERRPQ